MWYPEAVFKDGGDYMAITRCTMRGSNEWTGLQLSDREAYIRSNCINDDNKAALRVK